LYRDRKLSVSLCVFVRRFSWYTSGLCGLVGGLSLYAILLFSDIYSEHAGFLCGSPLHSVTLLL
jgi:hypothetical protein